MKKIAVIGGGPAGMMAAQAAAEMGAIVTLYEKNEKLGKKLYITGKGRCNLTNACRAEDFFDHIVTNPKFLRGAFYSFTNSDTVDFFEERGLKLKQERGMRIFPASDKSSDVIKTLERAARGAGVRVKLNHPVKNPADLGADRVIIATGGMSYRSTGSTGDGYLMAKKLGHNITSPVPALVPLVAEEKFTGRLEGLSLRNVAVSLEDGRGKVLFKDFGEMLFTSKGVSGPLILTASSYISRRLEENGEKFTLHADLKPALCEKRLDERVLRDFKENANRNFANSLGKLLPAKLIPVVVELSGIPAQKKVHSVTGKERKSLVGLLKDFRLTITKTEGFSRAVITQGGVGVRDINPKTMESKLAPGIYFAGEIIDVDALTGGFNIQTALSTGALAGRSAAKD